MISILEFLINFISDFLVLMNVELLKFNGVSITWLNILLASALIPILFSMFKVSFSEMNYRNDFNLINDIKGISHKKFMNKSKKGSSKSVVSKSGQSINITIPDYDWLNED